GSQKDSTSGAAAGSAYVFVRQGSDWHEQQRLEPIKPVAGATFGWSTAIQGDTIVVGAPRARIDLNAPSGQAYIFERSQEHWAQTGILEAPIPRETDYFGVDLALTTTGLLLGASGDGSAGTGLQADPNRDGISQSGAVYLYARQGSQFSFSTFIKAS